ncbi:MAG TPA: 3-hydroxyacyl-CoA dehydrogenase family protein [Aggregatilinea sp.]|uniref:3-hydroxyacyl-CoA dehydrogenase family protein n=1 Tax=Aggregatilinea sp. TaxID=2806333 RepID=UPI002B5D18C4|nr:3-hydroxyacyl-CoA dehydrogenase family protein [Aggregatilinea sp.]HML24454.1 3-hydroxyacyl-CoA dehydrogenase family protein [Aggregatilinea sp.]
MVPANTLQIAIVGAGTMGANIAQAVALGGCDVILHDIDRAVLRQALGRISRGIDQGVRLGKVDPVRARRAKRSFTLVTDVARCASADIAIEAVFDDPDLKQTVLREIDTVISDTAILATSSNTLSPSALAGSTRQPERVIGLHFCNPAHIMQLVEVVRTEHTDPASLERATSLVRAIGKTPVVVEDSPGLLVNRIGQAYWGEGLRLLDENGLDLQTIDRLMESIDFPLGPFHLMDFLGVDTVHSVTQMLWDASYQLPRYRPHPRTRRMLDAGQTGRKGHRGFYPPAE